MLVLYETAAGLALFKVVDEGKLKSVGSISKVFSTPESAAQSIKLQEFAHFGDTIEALSTATALVKGKISQSLKNLIKSTANIDKEKLIVQGPKLGVKLTDTFVALNNEIARGIRQQISSLLADQNNAMSQM
ncbi:hypothetical protein BB560_007234 [Smittium megazygosporum]|uniref:Nucleolar protein 58/56 N-terminal domain-containing protein n=1 Tax=Smittium megazygosporum TaxID=133381 RepID=A0A2T9XXU4_9FUNG|nr:hypothetical protein BB560_007234 [Smittium megazygosporum]